MNSWSAFVGKERCQLEEQRAETVAQDHPDQIEAYFPVAVDKTVAHARDFAPRDFRMGSSGCRRELSRRLAENFQRSNSRILVQPARKKSGLVEFSDKALRITGCQQHIEEKRRGSLRQVSHIRFRPLSELPGDG